MPLRHILLATLVAAIWGFNFVVIKVGVAALPPFVLSTIRFLLTAFPLIFFLPKPNCSWKLIAGFGLAIGVVSFGFLFVGIALGMPAGLSSVVLQSQAFFTILFAVMLFGERIKKPQILAGAIALGGLAIIGAYRMLETDLLPLLLVIFAAAAWAVANMVTKLAGKINMLSFVVWSSLFSPIPLLVLSLLFEGPEQIQVALENLNWTGFGAVLYLAYFSTIVGFGIWSFLIAEHSAGIVAPFSLLVPVFGISSAYLVLGETFSVQEGLGCLLLVIALAINTYAIRNRC